MALLTRQRLRIGVDTARFEQVKEVRTAAAPVLWRGNDVAFEVGLFRGAELLGISNFASMTMEIKANDAAGITGVPLASRTIPAGNLDGTLDAASWADESQQHALFAFSGAETAFDLGGELEKVFYFALFGLTTDVPVRRVMFGFGLLKVKESGATGLPPVVAENNGTFRLKNGNEFQLRDQATNEWRSLLIYEGVVQIGDPES
ncbi:MAG: hypothetical protein B9S32_17395 [Verrucomicrobia bacterium Tous-C9LFEB]|nr:MAG: hypothetical protein B9S32_17395 [Verrucomicrobia bacterium Tous-C9LFEB]